MFRHAGSARVAAAALAGLVALIGAAPVGAAPPVKPPPITWSPTSVSLSVTAGDSTSASAQFTASKKTSNVAITSTGATAPFVHPTPTSIKSVTAGSAVTVNLAVTVPAGTTAGNYSGQVVVSSGKMQLANVLAVSIEVLPSVGHLYWVGANTIGRAGLDGSNADEFFIPAADTGGALGLAVDDQYIYWSNLNSNPPTIGRANLDGSAPDSGFITLISGANTPYGITVDDQYIYWADPQVPAIGRANLDGTDVQPNFINLGPGALPTDVAVDGNSVYWMDQCRTSSSGNCTSSAIGRANLDGSLPTRDFIALGGVAGWGIAVDAAHVYWSKNVVVCSPGCFFSALIDQADIDGSDAVNLVTYNTVGTDTILGVEVDAGHLYWAHGQGGDASIGRADIDGANAVRLFIDTVGANFVAVGG